MENFSKKFQSPTQNNVNATKEGKEEDGDKRKKKKKANENILAQTKTDNYADDESLYEPRYTKKQRLEYWALLMQNTSRELKIPDNFDSWIKNEIADTVDQWFRFPSRLTYLFAFIRSNNWDQWFINFFIFWLFLAIFIGDGWAAKYVPFQLNMQNELLMLPIIAMLICQIIPFLGTIYYMNYCYDLVHYSAQINFSQWAFVSALTAQFIEYFYYGGRGRRDAAGRCAYGEEDHPPNTAILRWIKGKIKSIAYRARKKGAKIADIESAAADEVAVKEEKGNDMAVVVAENKMEQDDESTVGALHPSDSLEANPQGNEPEKDVEYADWVCVVCGKENHRPRHPFIEHDLIFGSQGFHFKRLTVAIKPRRDMPECAKCFTYMDYKPPAASRHLFNTATGRYDVFKDYPRVSRIQAALKTDKWTRRKNKVYSFFFGPRDREESAGIFNDWRLRMYVRGIVPEPFRVVLAPDERYREGEIVECRQQKAAWTRAKILHVRFNNTYDVKYDTGDEVRFVAPTHIRLLAEKKPFAYAVEIGMAMLVLSFPLCLLLSMSGSQGMLCLGLLLVSAVLLAYRILLFVQYVYNYSNAGCYQISVINLIFTLPLLLSMFAAISAVASAGPVQWTGVAIQLIIAMYFSLPALYMIRRTYALIGVVLFTLTAMSLYLMAALVDETLHLPYPTAISVFPALVFLGICKYIRKYLHTLWDVCLVIRTARDVSFSNVSILSTLRKKLSRA